MNRIYCHLIGALLATGVGQIAGQESAQSLPPTEIDETAATLAPKTPRTEADRDELTAAALFAHGRLLLQRGEQHTALSRFERALRYDTDSVSIAREIISLASRLGRHGEATRYAVLAAEQHPDQFPMLSQLGTLLIRQGETERAIRFLERALALEMADAKNASRVATHIELGRIYLLHDQPKSAADHFAVVSEALNNPDRLELKEEEQQRLVNRPHLLFGLMAESFLQAGRLDEADSVYKRLNETQPNPNLLAFHEARVAAARKDWLRAIKLLDTYLTSESTEAGTNAYTLLEQVLLAGSEPTDTSKTEFLDRLAELAEKFPDRAALNYIYGERLAQRDQLDEAEAVYQRALANEPTTTGYQQLVAIQHTLNKAEPLLTTLADVIEKTGTLSAVKDQIDEIDPESPLLDKLLEAARARSTQKPRFAAALVAMALGEAVQGVELLKAALDAPSDVDRHELLQQAGLALFMADHPTKAAEVFEMALAEDAPDVQWAIDYYYLAGAFSLANEEEQAIKAAEKAAELNDSPRFRTRPAWILYHAKRFDEAQDRYQTLIQDYAEQYDSENAREVVRDARLILSSIAVIEERYAEAEEYLDQVLDEFPEDIGAMNDLGYLWADQNKHLARALKMVKRAVEAAPKNSAYRDSLGWAYYRLGQFDNAVRELEQAADVDEPDGVILDHLADAYLKLERKEEALATWRRAVDAFKRDDEPKSRSATQAKIKQHE
jgi:tetratricopeptide (TPR) repeat protein